MATSFHPDRFDEIPSDLERVGAHRVPRKRGRGWIGFAWAALATLVLVGVGVGALFVLNDKLSLGAGGGGGSTPSASAPPSETAAPVVAPTVDPALAVTVLNGTPTAGLAAAVGDTLVAAGWNVTTRSNAATEDVVDSTVYYSDPALEGAALGAAASVPGAGIALSQDFVDLGQASLVVVIGSTFPVPEGE
ncbi:MAG: LytR C-terminal domain-containing protein [Microterricola sp.]